MKSFTLHFIFAIYLLHSFSWAQDDPTVKIIQSKTALYTFDTACWYKPNNSARALLNLNQGTLLVDLDTMDWGSLRTLKPEIKFGQQLAISAGTGLLVAGGGFLLDQSIGIPGLFTVLGFSGGFLYTAQAIANDNQNRRSIDLYDLKENSDNFRHYFVRCDPRDTGLLINTATTDAKFRKLVRTNEFPSGNNTRQTIQLVDQSWKLYTPYYYNMYTQLTQSNPYEKWGAAKELCKTSHTIQYLDLEERRIVDSLNSLRSLIFINKQSEAEPIQFHMDSLPLCSANENLDSLKKATQLKSTLNTWLLSYYFKPINVNDPKNRYGETLLSFWGLGHSIPHIQLYKDLHFLSLQLGGAKDNVRILLNYQSFLPIFKGFGVNPSFSTPITHFSEHTFDLSLYLTFGGSAIYWGKSWGSSLGYQTQSYSFGIHLIL